MNSYEAFKKIFTDQGKAKGIQESINTFASFLRRLDSKLSETESIDLATGIVQNDLDEEDNKYIDNLTSALRSKTN